MITVVIATHDSARLLGPLLSSLVPAAIDGLVREVVVADAGSTDGTLDIAEDCGARIVQVGGDVGTRLLAGCAAPRGDWLLVLEPDAVLPEGWRTAVERHLAGGPDKAAWLPRADAGWFQRLTGGGPPQGLLVSTRCYGGSSGFKAGNAPLSRQIGTLKASRLAW